MDQQDQAAGAHHGIKAEITSGNVWSMIISTTGFIALLFAGWNYVAEIREKNAEQDQRLQHVEQDQDRIERVQESGITKIERRLDQQDGKLDLILEKLGEKVDRTELGRQRPGDH